MDGAAWDLTLDLIKLLKPFNKTTTILQSRHEPTLSFVLPAIMQIKTKLSIYILYFFLTSLDSISPLSPKGKIVKEILLRQLSQRFTKIFLMPEYFLAAAVNPLTKDLLNNYEDWFQKLITDELQRGIDEHLTLEEREPTPIVSPSKKNWVLKQVRSTPTAVLQSKELIREWMELPMTNFNHAVRIYY